MIKFSAKEILSKLDFHDGSIEKMEILHDGDNQIIEMTLGIYGVISEDISIKQPIDFNIFNVYHIKGEIVSFGYDKEIESMVKLLMSNKYFPWVYEICYAEYDKNIFKIFIHCEGCFGSIDIVFRDYVYISEGEQKKIL